MTGPVNYREPPVPAFLFDLDGTLIDSVYQNVIAWRNALATVDIDLSVWRIHRRIGMSGGLFISALLPRPTERCWSRDRGRPASPRRRVPGQIDTVRPLPGVDALLGALTDRGVPWPSPQRPPERREACPADAGARPALRRWSPGTWSGTPSRTPTCSWPPPRCSASSRSTPWWSGQRLGPARRPPGRVARDRPDVRRLRPRRAGAGRVRSDPAEMLARADELGVRNCFATKRPNHCKAYKRQHSVQFDSTPIGLLTKSCRPLRPPRRSSSAR